jgi:hypothetical protein
MPYQRDVRHDVVVVAQDALPVDRTLSDIKKVSYIIDYLKQLTYLPKIQVQRDYDVVYDQDEGAVLPGVYVQLYGGPEQALYLVAEPGEIAPAVFCFVILLSMFLLSSMV